MTGYACHSAHVKDRGQPAGVRSAWVLELMSSGQVTSTFTYETILLDPHLFIHSFIQESEPHYVFQTSL